MDILPLSHIQTSMLQSYFVYPDSYSNFEFQHFILRGQMDAAKLAYAWKRVFQLHPILNSKIGWSENSDVYQIYLEREPPITILDARDGKVREEGPWTKEREKYRVDITKAVFEVCLLVQPTHADLFMNTHHMVYDGWSTNIILRDFVHIYRNLFDPGTKLELARDPGYKCLLKYQQKTDYAGLAEFYRRHLEGYKAAPAKRHGMNMQYNEKKTYRHKLNMVYDELFWIAEKLGVPPSTVMIALWARQMMRWKKAEQVVVGVVFSGRNIPIPEVENCVGPFINVLPLLVKNHNIFEMIWKIHRDMAELASLQEIPYRPEFLGAPNLSYETVVLFQNYVIDNSLVQASEVCEIQHFKALYYPQNFITFEIKREDENILFEYRYTCARYTEEQIAAVSKRIAGSIRALCYEGR